MGASELGLFLTLYCTLKTTSVAALILAFSFLLSF